MDPESTKLIFSSLSGGGVAGVFAFLLFKAYTANIEKMFNTQEKRMDSLEAKSKTCEDDRILMRGELLQFHREVIADTRTALNRSSAILEQFAKMAEEKGFAINGVFPKDSE